MQIIYDDHLISSINFYFLVTSVILFSICLIMFDRHTTIHRHDPYYYTTPISHDPYITRPYITRPLYYTTPISHDPYTTRPLYYTTPYITRPLYNARPLYHTTPKLHDPNTTRPLYHTTPAKHLTFPVFAELPGVCSQRLPKRLRLSIQMNSATKSQLCPLHIIFI